MAQNKSIGSLASGSKDPLEKRHLCKNGFIPERDAR